MGLIVSHGNLLVFIPHFKTLQLVNKNINCLKGIYLEGITLEIAMS